MPRALIGLFFVLVIAAAVLTLRFTRIMNTPSSIAAIAAEAPYDFRASKAYRELSADDREKLEQVHRDFMMLWGALDRYADHHDGDPPDILDGLVPYYLGDLPTDPFSTAESAQANDADRYHPSKDGWGYRYRKGASGNRAWCLSSLGLPGFPFLAAHGNVDLYICKGTWISGINPVSRQEKESAD